MKTSKHVSSLDIMNGKYHIIMTIERQIATWNHHAVKTGKMGEDIWISIVVSKLLKAAATLKRLAYLTPYYAVATFLINLLQLSASRA